MHAPKEPLSLSACDCAHTHNTCDPQSGTCICPPHTRGLQCEECEDGYWGRDLERGCQVCHHLCLFRTEGPLAATGLIAFPLSIRFTPLNHFGLLKSSQIVEIKMERGCALKPVILDLLLEVCC